MTGKQKWVLILLLLIITLGLYSELCTTTYYIEQQKENGEWSGGKRNAVVKCCLYLLRIQTKDCKKNFPIQSVLFRCFIKSVGRKLEVVKLTGRSICTIALEVLLQFSAVKFISFLGDAFRIFDYQTT